MHPNPEQYSDQMFCARCGEVWDVNDRDEPECVAPEDRKPSGRSGIEWIKGMIDAI